MSRVSSMASYCGVPLRSTRRVVLLTLISIAALVLFTGVSEFPTEGTAKFGSTARSLEEQHVKDGEQASEDKVGVVACEEDHAGSEEEEENHSASGRPVKVTVRRLKFTVGYTVAVLMVTFLFADFVLLYLVNWRDPNTRSYIYKMISSTMSIFLAVTINAAAFSFLMDQVIAGEGRGFLSDWTLGLDKHMDIGFGGLKLSLEFVVGLFLFAIAFSSVSALGYMLRDPVHKPCGKLSLYSVRMIIGHVAAFAGITAFGELQIQLTKVDIWSHHHYIPVFGVLAFLMAIRFLSRKIRTRYLSDGCPVKIRTSIGGSKSADPADQWRVEVCEAEDEATSLIMSFLINQASIWCITAHMNALHGKTLEDLHSWDEIKWMFIMLIAYTFGLATSVLLRKYIKSNCLGKDWEPWMIDPTRGYLRTMNNLQMTSAMCMSWCIMTAGCWITQIFLDKSAADNREMAKIANAVVITFLAVVCVVVGKSIKAAVAAAAKKVVAAAAAAPSRVSSIGMLSPRARGGTGDVGDAQVDAMDITDNVERIFLTFTDASGLLVGLCWEKATDAAVETIIRGNCSLANHPVVSRMSVALLMFAGVFTAWVTYIIPKAQKTSKQHELDLSLERVLRKNPKLTGELLQHVLEIQDKELDVGSIVRHSDSRELETAYCEVPNGDTRPSEF